MELGYFDQPSNLSSLKELVDSGVAVIPVDDKKEPFAPFKGKKVLGLVELVDAIRFYKRDVGVDVKRVAIRTGVISLGLVCLDVDSKHKEGISERIYTDFQNLYPELLAKMRVERSPSGGLHFYYQVVGELGGDAVAIQGRNLAYRLASEDELVVDGKKERCFLELKAADGGLVTCFPSIGYSVVKAADGLMYFGCLSLEEHQTIFEFCHLYDEVVKVVPIRSLKSRDSIYEEGKTPFDQFNLSEKGSEVLSELGWRFFKSSGKVDMYVKPGKKDNGIGAQFNREKRTYAIYTTNSGIEVGCYNPSSLLCKEKFNGDWSALSGWLVGQGYGKLKSFVEKDTIKKAIRDGIELPKNISEQGVKEYKDGLEKKSSKYPYGEFWLELDEGKWEISRQLLYKVSSDLGFRLHKEKVVLIDGYIIKEVDDRGYFDKLKEYIIGEDWLSVNLELLDVYEEFLQKSGKFTVSRLEVLDIGIVLRSTKKESYKFYKNCYIRIDRENYEVLNYSELSYKVWEKDIKDRHFSFLMPEELKKGLYWEFIKNAIGWSEYLMKCIGFYAHDHRDEEGYLIITTEKCENPKDGAGSGKNIFWELFKLTTTFKSTPASMISFNNNLLQSWDYQIIFVLSDVPIKKNDGKPFDLLFFKDIVTGNATVNKKYINEFSIDISEMCKIGASSNYSFDDSDPGIKRRLRPIEFTDFYTRMGGVRTYHDGKMFPKDWSESDYLLYDNIIAACIQEYLAGDSIIDKVEISDTGWAKKQEQNYKHLYDFIKGSVDEWVLLGKVSSKKLNLDYDAFREESNIGRALSGFSINKALSEYCEHFKIPFVHSYRKSNGEMSDGVVWKENGVGVKGRLFGDEAAKFLKRNGIVEIGMVSVDGEISKELSKEDLPF